MHFYRNNPKKTLKKRKGMTFIEIIIVVAIIAGLLAIVGPSIINQFFGAQVDTARIQIRSLQQSLNFYRLDTANYPSTEQSLDALLDKPSLGIVPNNWQGPYLSSNKLPKDPWGRDYVYTSDQSTFEIISYGADGREGGEGNDADITSNDL